MGDPGTASTRVSDFEQFSVFVSDPSLRCQQGRVEGRASPTCGRGLPKRTKTLVPPFQKSKGLKI